MSDEAESKKDPTANDYLDGEPDEGEGDEGEGEGEYEDLLRQAYLDEDEEGEEEGEGDEDEDEEPEDDPFGRKGKKKSGGSWGDFFDDDDDEDSDSDEEEGEEDEDDLFGQAAIKAKKKSEDVFRERTGSWADADKDEEEDDEEEGSSEEEDVDIDGSSVAGAQSSAGGGGMMDLLGRSKAAKEELAAKEAKEAEMKKRKRKRKTPAKDKGKKEKDLAKELRKSLGRGGKDLEEEVVWVEPEYDTEQFISKPICNTNAVPNNILKFYESYGYDSGRHDNLHMMDENTLLYISGNYLHFYSLKDGEVFLCRRAAAGYGLGHIALHPSREYFAVGEKGHNPIIVVYTWPAVSVFRVLKRGTTKGYSFLNFSPPGDFLCSQGMDPDYMLTIWDWMKEKVLLRCKAFQNDVYRVSFSPTLPGDLTTCGVGHIRFWKMAETFTGLKLQGAIGRFGKTEISDIHGYVELPNGKVLSGCEWGNILVWEGGLIVCEICGVNEGDTLHKGEITSLIMMTETNEILTVGKDGYLKIWDVDTIDIADTLVDDSGKYPVEPSHEIRLSGDAAPQGAIWNLNTPERPSVPQAPEPGTEAPGMPQPAQSVAAAAPAAGLTVPAEPGAATAVPPSGTAQATSGAAATTPAIAGTGEATTVVIPSMWFCQDSWGRIWDVNIAAAIQDNTYSPAPIFYTPGGGPINCLCCSVEHTILALGTAGGHLWIIDYITKNVLVRRHYKTSVNKLLWMPLKYDPRGVSFLAAFGDGCIRCYSIQPITPDTEHEIEDVDDDFRRGHPCEIGLNQELRFCKGSITVMKFDEESEILYVCGEDRSLWGVYLFYDEDEDCVVMEPLAYFKTPFIVYHLDLHPLKPYRMILAGKSSRVAECRRPEWTECMTEKTFFQGKLRGRRWWFNSAKSERRKIERRDWRKVERERRIKELLEDIKRREALGIPVEEEIELARLNEEFRKAQQADDEEPIYRPEKPSDFLGIYYHINPDIGDKETMAKTFFVHMGDYDAGYIYECKCTRPEIGGFHGIPPTPPFEKSDDTDVAVKCWLLSDDDDFLLFGMADGSIRVMPRVNVQAKVMEMMRLEKEAAEEEAKKKRKGSGQDEDFEKSDVETEATTAPQITADETQQQRLKGKKKRKKSEGKRGGAGGIPPFTPSIYPYDLEKFFCLPMHDPNRGAVVEMCWSGDSQFLVSVGADGSIFSYRWDPDGYLEFATDNLPSSNIPSEMLECEFLEDEEDDLLQTVEEMKQQEEKEKVRGMQEEFKEDVRAELRDLKEVFRNIKQRNKEIPEQYRLTEEELKLPDEIYAALQKTLDDEVEEVFKIHEYESTENIIQMEKIEKAFFKPLVYPHIVVKDISHQIQTCTIRLKKLSADFLDLVDVNKDIMENEQVRETFTFTMKESEMEEESQPVVRVYAKEIIGEYEHKLHTYNVETLHNIKRLEKRLEERYHRELEWQELLKRKIEKDFVDPEDKARLDYAKSNRGDFKLQASESYLGEHETIAQRRQKIINMKLWIHQITEEYNKMVVVCREEKKEILKECRKLEEKIKLIQPFVPPELRRRLPPIHELTREEQPENEFEITQEEVEFEENTELHAAGLLEFRDQLNEETFGNMRPEKSLVVEEELKEFMAPSVRHTKSIDLEFENMTVHKYRKYIFGAKKEILREQSRYETFVWPRLIEQELLFKELLGIIEYFHQRVKYLHDYRTKLDIDLHIKHIGLLTLIRELDIAKEFESQEKGILERLRVQKEEFHDARHKMDKVKKRMTKMNADVKKLEGEQTVIQKEVQTVIGGSGKWADYLGKVFKKKVKLEPDEPSETQANRRDTSSDSSDSSESTSQDTGSDLYKLPKMKLNVNECPEHLDKTVYNKVCDLRQRKAVIEVEIENAKKAVEKVEEDYTELEKIYTTLEGRLTDTGQDIRVLQRRRQKRMNELKCMLILRIDQIGCVDMDEVGEVSGGVFKKLVKTFPSENKILVFPKGQTDQLLGRADELIQLKEQEILRMKNGRQMYTRLTEELKKAEKRVEDLKAEAKKDMVLKFGREVDLDKVCAAIINLELLDKEIQLDKLRKFQYYERQRLIDNILDAKDELTGEIRENSNLKILEAMILERRRDLDYFVWKNERDTEKRERREASRKMIMDPSREIELSKQSQLGDLQGATSLDGRASTNLLQKQQTNASMVDDEIQELKKQVRMYEMKAKALRNAMKICKRKSGLPPILPLERNRGPCSNAQVRLNKNVRGKLPPIKRPEDPRQPCLQLAADGSPKRYRRTAKEIEDMNDECPSGLKTFTCGVRTLYETNKTEIFDEDMTIPPTEVPSMATPHRYNQPPPPSPTEEEIEGVTRRSGGASGRYSGEYPGEGASTVKFFEEQFDEYLKTERVEVMEYLGEVDEEMFVGMVREADYQDYEYDEETEWTEEDEVDEEPPLEPANVTTLPKERQSVEVLEVLRKHTTAEAAYAAPPAEDEGEE